MYRVYGDKRSGNCYKVRLMMHLLEHKFTWVDVNIKSHEHAAVPFQSINPLKQVPVLELRKAQYLYESNAIINYLANGTSYMPNAKYACAKLQQWQFFEQSTLHPLITRCFRQQMRSVLSEAEQSAFDTDKQALHESLKLIDEQLTSNSYLVGSLPTTADISLFAHSPLLEYIPLSLKSYTSLIRWMRQIQQLDNYISIKG